MIDVQGWNAIVKILLPLFLNSFVDFQIVYETSSICILGENVRLWIKKKGPVFTFLVFRSKYFSNICYICLSLLIFSFQN